MYRYIGNEVIMKQIKTLKAKKTAAISASKTKKTKQLDEATMKEVSFFCFYLFRSTDRFMCKIKSWSHI